MHVLVVRVNTVTKTKGKNIMIASYGCVPTPLIESTSPATITRTSTTQGCISCANWFSVLQLITLEKRYLVTLCSTHFFLMLQIFYWNVYWFGYLLWSYIYVCVYMLYYGLRINYAINPDDCTGIKRGLSRFCVSRGQRCHFINLHS